MALAVLGEQLNSVISKVLFNPNSFVIPESSLAATAKKLYSKTGICCYPTAQSQGLLLLDLFTVIIIAIYLQKAQG